MNCEQQIVSAVLWTIGIECVIAAIVFVWYKIWEAFDNMKCRIDMLNQVVLDTRELLCQYAYKSDLKTEIASLSSNLSSDICYLFSRIESISK